MCICAPLFLPPILSLPCSLLYVFPLLASPSSTFLSLPPLPLPQAWPPSATWVQRWEPPRLSSPSTTGCTGTSTPQGEEVRSCSVCTLTSTVITPHCGALPVIFYIFGIIDNVSEQFFPLSNSNSTSPYPHPLISFLFPTLLSPFPNYYSPPSGHTDIAALAEKHSDILVPDEGAQYDRLVEINLDEVGRSIHHM